MSDTPEARPGAPRPPTKPVAAGSSPSVVARPGKPVPPAAPTPRKPLPSATDSEELLQLESAALIPAAVAPPIPPARKSDVGLIPPRPPSSHEIVTSAAPLPAVSKAPAPMAFAVPKSIVAAPPAAAPAPAPTPAPASNPREAETPVAPAVTPVAPAVEAAKPAAGTSPLTEAAQEQLTAILRTVLESTLAPVLEKHKELESRIEALQARKSAPSSRTPISSLTPVRSTAPSVDITGSFNSNAPGRVSMVNTSYGLVSVLPGPAPRPQIDVDLERVGPIDVPDFAGKRKFAGAIVIGVLILAVVGAIVATILSYS